MALTAKNRKKAEKLIYDTLAVLEPGGLNAAKYKALFSKMSDKEFVAFFTKIKNDENSHLYVENDLYGTNQITMDTIEAAAKSINVPLEEYYYIRHKTPDGKEIRSAKKVPIMYIHLKRMQQLLSKKVRTNVDITSGSVRSRITGALNSTNRTGRFTDSDVQALVSVTSETGIEVTEEDSFKPIMFELLNLRGDNNVFRSHMLQQIAYTGEVSRATMLQRMDKMPPPGQAMQTLDVYYLGAGMKTNLVDATYLLGSGIPIDVQSDDAK